MNLKNQMNYGYLNNPIFEENFSLYNEIELETPEPKWDNIFFKRLPESQINEFTQMINKQKYDTIPYYFFLRGIMQEYGINQKSNLQLALAFYRRGAEANDSYCLFKLYFIQRNHASEFNLEKSRDQEMVYLIKAAAYFDYYSDERYKFYPVYQLAVHLDKEDNTVVKCHNLIKKSEKLEIQNLLSRYSIYTSEEIEYQKKMKKIEYEFLDLWLSIRFYLSKEEQENAYKKLKTLAIEHKHIEASFLLSELYIGHIDGGNEYDFAKSEQMLIFCTENNLLKSYTALASLYEKMNDYPKALEFYLKAAKKGCYRGFYEYASFVICGYMTKTNFKKGLKYFTKGFWLGYMYSADHLVLVLNNSEYQKKNIFSEKDYQMCFDISTHLYKNYDFISNSFLKYGPQYYLIAICYEKGIHINKPNLDKALEILLEGEKDKHLKETKYVLYRLGRVYSKKRNFIKSNDYYQKAFLSYMEIIYDDKLTKYPAQFYRVAKLFENGWGVEKNLNLAIEFYKKGTVSSKYFFLLQFYYQNKCKKKYLELKDKITIKNFSLQKHSKQIVDIICIPPNRVVTLGSDSTILIWDVPKKKVIRAIYKAHEKPPNQLKYLSNGCLLSLGKDFTLKYWSIWNNKLIYSENIKNFVENTIHIEPHLHSVDMPILGEFIGKKFITVQLEKTKIKIFEIMCKKFLDIEFENMNIITAQKYHEEENLWLGGDNHGYLNHALLDKNFKILNTSKQLFHSKEITALIIFEKFQKKYIMTSSYDSKICVILYQRKDENVKLLLERKFNNESRMDLSALVYSNKFDLFFVGNCVGKILVFNRIFESLITKNIKKKPIKDSNIVEEIVLEGHIYEIKKIVILNEKYLISISNQKENFARVWDLNYLCLKKL